MSSDFNTRLLLFRGICDELEKANKPSSPSSCENQSSQHCLTFQCCIYLAKVPSKAVDTIFIARKNDAKLF